MPTIYMSASNPPTYYFTGIGFNSSFYVSADSTLTQTQASKLYLLKNSPDTATALESFTGGILTNSIKSTTASSTLNIATNLNLGTLNLGSGDATVQNMACNIMTGASVSGSINIGSAANTTSLNSTTTNIGTGTSSQTNINGGVNIARNATGIRPTYIECGSTTTLNYMDFHCNSDNSIDYDARISVSGGTTSSGEGDLSITSKSLTISSPLTLQPTASYVAPTALTMLGGITDGTFNTPASSFSSNKTIATITLTKGTYLLYFAMNANSTILPTTDYYITFTGTALPLSNSFFGGTRLTGTVLGYCANVPMSITTGGTVDLLFTLSGGTINNITQYSYKAMRIA